MHSQIFDTIHFQIFKILKLPFHIIEEIGKYAAVPLSPEVLLTEQTDPDVHPNSRVFTYTKVPTCVLIIAVFIFHCFSQKYV